MNNALLVVKYTKPTANPKAYFTKLMPASVITHLVSESSLHVFSVEIPGLEFHLQVLDHLALRDDVESAYWIVGSAQGFHVGGVTTGWIAPINEPE